MMNIKHCLPDSSIVSLPDIEPNGQWHTYYRRGNTEMFRIMVRATLATIEKRTLALGFVCPHCGRQTDYSPRPSGR